MLYYLYRPACYWYESVNMGFKLVLWSTLVFFEYGSELQMSAALVVNVMQLCAHIFFLPFGGPKHVLMNVLQFGTFVR